MILHLITKYDTAHHTSEWSSNVSENGGEVATSCKVKSQDQARGLLRLHMIHSLHVMLCFQRGVKFFYGCGRNQLSLCVEAMTNNR